SGTEWSKIMIVMLALLVIAAIAGWYAYRLAEQKGRRPRLWMVLTVFFLVPLLVLLVLPSTRDLDGSVSQPS
ncbi:MAG: hypothetical protein AAF412_07745, partial [Pseudomonadota bacterium]